MTSAANKKGAGAHLIKSGLLFFWAIYFFLFFLTNLMDLFASHNVLSQGWLFRSGNYALIISTIKIYEFTSTTAVFLFLCDITLQAIASILFLIASIRFCCHKKAWRWINIAFGVSMSLWALFIIMDELFIAYNYESTHINIFMLELLSLLAIHVLPDKRSSR